MDTIQSALLPLGAFWITFSALQSAASFVNEMRETIVTGYKGNQVLTVRHRKAMFFDWRLAMVGTIIAAFTFSGLIFFVSFHIRHVPDSAHSSPILAAVALFPLLGG